MNYFYHFFRTIPGVLTLIRCHHLSGLSQFGQWQTWAGAESSSSSCSKVQLGNSFRQGEQFKLKTSKWIKKVCTLQGRPPHHRHHPPWRLVRKQSSSPWNLMIYFPWCDKGGRKGLMILCISGKLLALGADFLNFMVEELVTLKRKKKFLCTITSVVGCLYQKKISVHSFFCNFTSTSFIQVVEWLWLDNVYEMCGGELEQHKKFYFQCMPLYLIVPQASFCYPFTSFNQGNLACSSQHMLLCLMRQQRRQERSGNFRQHWLFWLNLKALLDLSIGRFLY